jgi:hypothetical protein
MPGASLALVRRSLLAKVGNIEGHAPLRVAMGIATGAVGAQTRKNSPATPNATRRRCWRRLCHAMMRVGAFS